MRKKQNRNAGLRLGFRSGLEEQIARQLEEAGMKRVCEECGADISGKKSNARFCSRKCKGRASDRRRRGTESYKAYQKAYQERLKQARTTFRDTERQCRACCSPFKPRAHNQIYCSKRCKQAVVDARYRERHREERARKAREAYQIAIYGSPTIPEEMYYDKYRRARALGYRSGLEVQIANQLTELNIPFEYESKKISYIKPARNSEYTPDFILPNGIIIECKGKFEVSDRQKQLLIKEQYPELDIRFVFSNSRNRISKNSKTTYAAWCEKYGFLYSDKLIPREWLEEPPCPVRLAALEKARIKS